MTIPRYDAWRLAGPREAHTIGMELGDTCNRYTEPDEDAPRGYKPKPCKGEMIDDGGAIICDTCGSLAA